MKKVTCIRWRSLRPTFPTYRLPDLLHGGERKVWGDVGYQGHTKAIRQAAPKAQDMTCKRTRFTSRAKVEHDFRILKRVFGFDKVCYRGIATNHHRLRANFALINLYLHREHLAETAA